MSAATPIFVSVSGITTRNPSDFTCQSDLNSGSTSLSSHIEKGVTALYNLQSALINAHGHNSQEIRATFANLKGTLKENWCAIIDFLQKCCFLGADIVLFNRNIHKKGYKDNVEEYLGILEQFDLLLGTSSKIIADSETLSKEFSNMETNLLARLKNPILTQSVPKSVTLTSEEAQEKGSTEESSAHSGDVFTSFLNAIWKSYQSISVRWRS